MVKVETFSELVDKEVFTERGAYCGKVSDVELDLDKFRVRAIVVDAVRGSFLSSLVGGKKGVVIPFQVVQSIGDIVIIKQFNAEMLEAQARTTPEIEEQPAITF